MLVATKDKRGNTLRIYVNPYSGEVTGKATWMNAQRFFRDFHRRFYIMAWWGIWVVAIFSLPLLLTSITGLLFYKRWWKRLAVIRLRSGGRVFLSDLHRLLGVWTLLFTFVIGVTGIWYFVEIPLGWRPNTPQQTRAARARLRTAIIRPTLQCCTLLVSKGPVHLLISAPSNR